MLNCCMHAWLVKTRNMYRNPSVPGRVLPARARFARLLCGLWWLKYGRAGWGRCPYRHISRIYPRPRSFRQTALWAAAPVVVEGGGSNEARLKWELEIGPPHKGVYSLSLPSPLLSLLPSLCHVIPSLSATSPLPLVLSLSLSIGPQDHPTVTPTVTATSSPLSMPRHHFLWSSASLFL